MALELLPVFELVLALLFEPRIRGVAHGQHDDREGQRGDDAGGPQGGKPAGDQQNGRDQPCPSPQMARCSTGILSPMESSVVITSVPESLEVMKQVQISRVSTPWQSSRRSPSAAVPPSCRAPW